MLPGPVFNAELITTARRARYYVLRCVYGGFLLFLVWINDPSISGRRGLSSSGELSHNEMSALGASLFATFAVTQSIAVLMLTPAMVAGVIADERQRKTLHYLMSSRLNSGEIVLGKLAARLLHVGVFLLLGLPIVVMLSFFGGVDPFDVMLFFLTCGSTAFFLGALSIVVSTYARRPREAVSTVYVLELFWLFSPSLVAWLIPSFGPNWAGVYEFIRPVNEVIGGSNPFYLMTHNIAFMAGRLPFYHAATWMIAYQSLFGVVITAWTVFRLRPVFRKAGQSGGRIGRFFKRKSLRLLPRPACGDDGMLWKERYVARAGPLIKIVGGGAVLIVLALLVYGTYDFAKPAYTELLAYGYGSNGPNGARGDMNGWLRFVLTMMGGCLLVWCASSASSTLTSEREEDTWISLISTPLTAFEILRAKLVGVIWAVRWLSAVWLAFALTGLALGAIHPFGFAWGVMTTVTYVSFGCALGTYFSATSKSSARSLVATIAALFILNGGYLILLIPVRVESTIRFLGVTPFVEALSLVSYHDVESMLRGPGGREFSDVVDVGLTCVVSVLTYAVATVALTLITLARFDDINDRPKALPSPSARFDGMAFKEGVKPTSASLEEIPGEVEGRTRLGGG